MDSLWANIFKQDDAEREMHELLRGIPLFAGLGRRELEAVSHILYRREYAAGELIFRQEEPGLGMYILERGRVEIVFEPTGEVLTELVDGDFFGDVALLNETPRSATARARTACRLLCVFRPDLLELVDRNPRLGVKVLLALAQVAGQRLIRLSEEREALRLTVERLEARRSGDAAPGLHEDVDDGGEPVVRVPDREREPDERGGDGPAGDTLD